MQLRTLPRAQPLRRFKLIDYKRHLSVQPHLIINGKHEIRNTPCGPMIGFQSRTNSTIQRVGNADPIHDRTTRHNESLQSSANSAGMSPCVAEVSGRVSSNPDGAATDSTNRPTSSNARGEALQDSRPTITRVEFQPPFTFVPKLPAQTYTPSDFEPSNVVQVVGVGTTMTEDDIRLLVPPKKHLPNFRDDYDITHVYPYRDEKTFSRRPFYHLSFASPQAATKFAQERQQAITLHKHSEWPAEVPIPPNSTPDFLVLDRRSHLLNRTKKFRESIFRPHAGPGECVLLSTLGPTPAGGNKTRRPPKTAEIWRMLEEKEIRLCDEKNKKKGQGVEMAGEVLAVKKPSDEAVLKKWIIRCYDESEAHRVVREFHMTKPWEDSLCTFTAEVIY